MLAIVRAVKRFHVYLYGLKFAIVTDCNALVYAINKANLNPQIARWTLVLQMYDFKVTHCPGKDMAHVDALSCCVGYVQQRPLERELEFRQLADQKLSELSRELEVQESQKFALVDGLIYKRETEGLKFVVPETMIPSLIRAHHDDMAHCGPEKTLKGIKQNFWFSSMSKKIYNYVENCLTCLMANDSPNRLEGETILTSPPKTPLEIWHVDHFGPLQETSDSYKYIYVVVDAFTRFTWLFATKSTASREAINALRRINYPHGKPFQIVSDRGTAFTSKEFADFLKRNDIKHRLIAVAAPWANGIVERVDRFLKTSLTKLLNDASDWKKNLSKMQYIVNNTYHSAIKTSPSKLMFGLEQRNHADFPLAQYTKSLTEIDSDLEKIREVSRGIADKANELIRQYNKNYRDKNCKTPTKYKEGDYILIRNTVTKPGESAKLKPKYKGPYMIARVLENNCYVVKDIPGFNHGQKTLNTVMSPDRIKPWIKLIPLPETE